MNNKFILDTNLFFNLQSGLTWGKDSRAVFEKFVVHTKKLVTDGKVNFYMTPAIVEELRSFIDDDPEYLTDFMSLITIKSPSTSEMKVGAVVVRELVEESRNRAYRGMKVGEEEIDNIAKSMMGVGDLPRIEYQKKVGEVVTKFRDRFRQATRVGFLDSVADFELILLALEIDGALVSADEGLIKWGRMMGATEVLPSDLLSSLEILQ